MNNSYITIIKEKRTDLSRKRIPLNQNGCTADFRMSVPFEQNLHPETYNMYDSNCRQHVPVIGYPLTYYLTSGSSDGTFAIRTDYLATINNLATPVVKTTDKTMKVTYTLQEE